MVALDHRQADVTHRRSPRWWRRFVVFSRKANLFLILEIIAALAFGIMVWTTWYTFTSAPPDGQLLPSRKVAGLLIATLLPAMALVVLFGRRLALRRAAGTTARMHVRLVFFFSLVAAVPTLLVAAFAAFLFQSGVDFWFSDNSRGLMENANKLGRGYYEQNQVQVANQTVAMASDIQYYLQTFKLTDPDLADIYYLQVKQREINESAILQRVPDGSMRIAAVFDLNKGNQPTQFAQAAVKQLAAGEPVVVNVNTMRIESSGSHRSQDRHLSLQRAQHRIARLQPVGDRAVGGERLRRAHEARASIAASLQSRAFLRQYRACHRRRMVRAALCRPPGQTADRTGRRGAPDRRG